MPIIDFTNVEKVYRGSVEMKKVYEGQTVVWEKPVESRELPMYIELVNSTDSVPLQIMASGTTNKSLAYSYDNQNWTGYTATNNPYTIQLNSSNPRVYFRASTNGQWNTSSSIYWYFKKYATSSDVPLRVGGNIYSLENTGDSYKDVINPRGSYSFFRIFQNFTCLTDASNLYTGIETTKLTNYCFGYAFENCTSLVNPPKLSAEILADYCYEYMFQGCTSLRTLPEDMLPAEIARPYCYYYMFNGCTSLTNIPELPAGNVVGYAYSYMFSGCTSLTSVEVSPVIIAPYGMSYMFNGCTSLNQVKCMAANVASNATSSWLNNTSSSGTITKYSGVSNITYPTGWTSATESPYPCIKNEYSGNNVVTITRTGTPGTTLQRSKDSSTWTNVTNTTSITLYAGEKLYLKSTTGCSKDASNYWSINASQPYSVEGDIRYISGSSTLPAVIPTEYMYFRLFNGSTTLKHAHNLKLAFESFKISATSSIDPSNWKFATYIYGRMFGGCTSLLTAPKLPNLNGLSSSCYSRMFGECTSLTNAPSLPMETVVTFAAKIGYNIRGYSASSAYSYMFAGCTSLTKPPVICMKDATSSIFSSMFQDCTSLVRTPRLQMTILYINYNTGSGSWITYGNNICKNMFAGCTSLKEAPALPYDLATTVSGTSINIQNAYEGMFQGCTSLIKAGEISCASISKESCKNMFNGCTSLVNAPKIYATSVGQYGCESMFEGCTSMMNGPSSLGSASLNEGSYKNMFNGCTSLNYIKCLATNISATGCLTDWVSGVASSGTFVKASSMSSWPTGASGIPSGWTIQNA